ncbi:MAG: UDP-N-acetylmuramoyl-L-alanyl-D-glutamate--2,6-diaminopimelate ligase [Balneolaceae bacterium]
MNVSELIAFCEPLSVIGQGPGDIGSLSQDSRTVNKGDIFIAVRGYTSDGHAHIGQAVENGATVVIAEEKTTELDSVVQIIVQDTRELIGPLSQKLAGNPAQKLITVGITGTNGKTTVATLIWQTLTGMGQPASLLGTVGKRFNRKKAQKAGLTTADPIEIARDMKTMVEMGSRFVVMEVSSHALEQQRTKGIPFDVGVFTNLSHDHLDYHKTEENYAKAKKKLFDSLPADGWAITNTDDARGEWIVKDCSAKIIGLSFHKHAAVQANIIEANERGTQIDVEDLQLKTPLVGTFNAYNAVQALLTTTALGFDGQLVAETLAGCKGAPGRLERVEINKNKVAQPAVFVDYAHTPDALENVCKTLKNLKHEGQQLAVLFGCGGDRDRTKRPEMAKIAEEYADRIIVTSDNPRTEDPQAIIDEILKGFADAPSVESTPSRRAAIESLILEASADDILLIAGKGHETYQEINGKRNHFDDREEALAALEKRTDHVKPGGA